MNKTRIITEFVRGILDHKAAAGREGGPAIIGLTGPQGSGKSTVCREALEALRQGEFGGRPLKACVLSLDDLYLTHAEQLALAARYPDNELLQQRGEPGTHDLELAQRVFDGLATVATTGAALPIYDKSLHQGRGDRLPAAEWLQLPAEPLDVVLFEGWMVGFRAVSRAQVEHAMAAPGFPQGRHGPFQLEHLLTINQNLKQYESLFLRLDALIHLDTLNIGNVYHWRLEQEHAMIKRQGIGMSDEQVKQFIDAYMPAYYIYLDSLRAGIFPTSGRQLRLVLDEQRQVTSSETV